MIPDEIIERDYGCGDPTPFVQPGDTVLDLGSGAGKLCYIAAQVTGAKGRVIGIDCNQEVLSLARKHIETRNWQETTCKTETRKDNAIACFSQTKAVVHRCSGTHQSSETPRLSSEFWRIRLQRSATAFPEVVIRLLARKF